MARLRRRTPDDRKKGVVGFLKELFGDPLHNLCRDTYGAGRHMSISQTAELLKQFFPRSTKPLSRRQHLRSSDAMYKYLADLLIEVLELEESEGTVEQCIRAAPTKSQLHNESESSTTEETAVLHMIREKAESYAAEWAAARQQQQWQDVAHGVEAPPMPRIDLGLGVEAPPLLPINLALGVEAPPLPPIEMGLWLEAPPLPPIDVPDNFNLESPSAADVDDIYPQEVQAAIVYDAPSRQMSYLSSTAGQVSFGSGYGAAVQCLPSHVGVSGGPGSSYDPATMHQHHHQEASAGPSRCQSNTVGLMPAAGGEANLQLQPATVPFAPSGLQPVQAFGPTPDHLSAGPSGLMSYQSSTAGQVAMGSGYGATAMHQPQAQQPPGVAGDGTLQLPIYPAVQCAPPPRPASTMASSSSLNSTAAQQHPPVADHDRVLAWIRMFDHITVGAWADMSREERRQHRQQVKTLLLKRFPPQLPGLPKVLEVRPDPAGNSKLLLTCLVCMNGDPRIAVQQYIGPYLTNFGKGQPHVYRIQPMDPVYYGETVPPADLPCKRRRLKAYPRDAMDPGFLQSFPPAVIDRIARDSNRVAGAVECMEPGCLVLTIVFWPGPQGTLADVEEAVAQLNDPEDPGLLKLFPPSFREAFGVTDLRALPGEGPLAAADYSDEDPLAATADAAELQAHSTLVTQLEAASIADEPPVAVVADKDPPASMADSGPEDSRNVPQDPFATTALSPATSALLRGAKAGDVEAVRQALVEGAVVDAEDEEGLTALQLAAVHDGSGEIARLLLAARASLDTQNTDGGTALYLAALNGHAAVVQLLLGAGANSSLQDKFGNTPLVLAASNGHHAVVQNLLLGAGANLDLKGKDGTTALCLAARKGHKAVVELLLGAGAALNMPVGDGGFTALQAAAWEGHQAVVQLLLEAHACCFVPMSQAGMTALQAAVCNGHEAVVQLLLEAGADPDVQDQVGVTALQLAAVHDGSGEIARLLLAARARLDAQNAYGATALYLAAMNGHAAVVQLLLGAGANSSLQDKHGYTALHAAAKDGHEAVVALLLGTGADVAVTDKVGNTPLHMAAWNGHHAVVQLLLEAGANLDLKGKAGRTALFQAVMNNKEGMVQLLLQAGAQVDLQDRLGSTCLHLAARRGCHAVVSLLLEAGANAAMIDQFGCTPLHEALKGGNAQVVQLLLKHSASLKASMESGPSVLHLAAANGDCAVIKALLAERADLSHQNQAGQTALHLAAEHGHKGLVHLLLQAGAEVDICDMRGLTAVHLACINGHQGVVHMLLKQGGSATATDLGKNTPLHLAAKYMHVDVAHVLLQFEASTSIKNMDGLTPLDVAYATGGNSNLARRMRQLLNRDAKDHCSEVGPDDLMDEALMNNQATHLKPVSSGKPSSSHDNNDRQLQVNANASIQLPTEAPEPDSQLDREVYRSNAGGRNLQDLSPDVLALVMQAIAGNKAPIRVACHALRNAVDEATTTLSLDAEPHKPCSQLPLLTERWQGVTALRFSKASMLSVLPSGIAALPRLEEVDISSTAVADLGLLAECKRLKVLKCSATKVDDLEPLAACASLEVLDCSDTRVSSLEALATCDRLTQLNCTSTQVTDLKPLASCTMLMMLHCAYTDVADLSPLQELERLVYLDCGTTAVVDLGPLRGCKDMLSLNCNNTGVRSLEPLAECKALIGLSCRSTDVASITPLAACPDLEFLEITCTPVSSITALADCPKLNYLACADTKVDNLSPLAACPALTTLRICGSRVRDLRPLMFCTQLKHLISDKEQRQALLAAYPELEICDEADWDGDAAARS